MTVAVDEKRRPARTERLVWYAVLGGPLAWGFQLVVGYGLEEAACSTGSATDTIWGAGVGPVSAAVAIAAGIVALGAVVAGLLAWRALRRDERRDPRGRARFMAVFGALGSALFLLTIVLSGAAIAALDPCAAG